MVLYCEAGGIVMDAFDTAVDATLSSWRKANGDLLSNAEKADINALLRSRDLAYYAVTSKVRNNAGPPERAGITRWIPNFLERTRRSRI
jgi:hypothetical protein